MTLKASENKGRGILKSQGDFNPEVPARMLHIYFCPDGIWTSDLFVDSTDFLPLDHSAHGYASTFDKWLSYYFQGPKGGRGYPGFPVGRDIGLLIQQFLYMLPGTSFGWQGAGIWRRCSKCWNTTWEHSFQSSDLCEIDVGYLCTLCKPRLKKAQMTSLCVV